MLQYFFLFLVYIPLCASEKESAKQKEDLKFALIEGDNIFTVTKGTFPYFDQLVESFSDRPVGITSAPIPISQNSNVNQQTVVELQKIVDSVKQQDPIFFNVANYWAEHGRYKIPQKWEETVQVLFPLNTPVQKFVDLVQGAHYLQAYTLQQLILNVLSDRLISGQLKNFHLDHPDIDRSLAQILIDKALIVGTEVTTTTCPLGRDGRMSQKAEHALLCPTAALHGGLCVTTNPGKNIPYVSYSRKITEEELLGKKWLHYQSVNDLELVFASDCSSDLKYQVILYNDKGKNYLAVRKTGEDEPKELVIQGSTLHNTRIVFENIGYKFFLKNEDGSIYINDAENLFEAHPNHKEPLKIDTIEKIKDPFIQRYLEQGKDHDKICRCLCQHTSKTFSTQVLHSITYSSTFANKVQNKQLMQTACNYDGYVHTLLLQEVRNTSKFYSLVRVQFKPATQIISLLDRMNELDKIDTGNLYANALCIYYGYLQNWILSEQELRTKMGLAYDNIDSIVKNTVLGTITSSLFSRARKIYNDYSASIKRSLGLLRIPFIATAAIGALKYGRPELLAITPAVYFIYEHWNTKLSEQGHLWTAQQLKTKVYTATKRTALWLGVVGAALYFSRYPFSPEAVDY